MFHKLGMLCNALLFGCQLQTNENRLLLLKMHPQIILQEVPLKWKLPQRTFLQTGHCTSFVCSNQGQSYITHSILVLTLAHGFPRATELHAAKVSFVIPSQKL